jgi:hypothetical protein
MKPKYFLAIYECEDCGDEYEMQNCYVPYVNLPCDDCGGWRKFYSQKMIHQDWEWDSIED